MLRAVMRPVFGFSDGMFSIIILNEALSASTSMRCVLRVSFGSAHTSIIVRSAPMPARPSAAATFRFSGKPIAASAAVPLNTCIGSVMFDMSMPLAWRCAAPSRPFTGLREIMRTEFIFPSAAAVTASKPSSAPLGTMICAPCRRASSMRSLALQKRPDADDNEPPTGTQSGLGHFPQRIGGRGVDDDVGERGKILQRHDRHRVSERTHSLFRFGGVTRRDGGKPQARNSAVEGLRDPPADGAEAANGDMELSV